MTSMARVLRYRFGVRVDADGDALHGWAPALPGMHTFGDTEEETLANLREAVQVHVECLLMDGEPVPDDPDAASSLHQIEAVVPWSMISRA
ncbi:MAG: type II toxin-antitoxin system HicB family antitoxin [Chloroflexi bacterium]|nr:type II toxin-antitoxin system HicB family antitoxin [Chloroflexota bacterium]